MEAIKSNLEDQTNKPYPRDIMYCEKCGTECSANKGDYWNVPDNHVFTCCGEPMSIGYFDTRFIPSDS